MTRLPVSAPLAHRIAHHLGQRGWRGARFYWRLAARVTPYGRSGALEVADGAVIDLQLTDATEMGFYQGTYKPGELSLPRRFIRPAGCSIDVGANIGLFTIELAALSGPSGTVLAIEPARFMRERLLRHVAPLTQVTVLPYAAGASRSSGTLTRWHGNTGVTSLRDDLAFGDPIETETVSIRSLDEIADEYSLTEVDFLKVSAIGWESELLGGATGLFARESVRAALVEIHPPDQDASWLRALASAGSYRCFRTEMRAAFAGLRLALRLVPFAASESTALGGQFLLVRADLTGLVDDLRSPMAPVVERPPANGARHPPSERARQPGDGEGRQTPQRESL